MKEENSEEENRKELETIEKVSVSDLGKVIVASEDEEETQKNAILKDKEETEETKQLLINALTTVEKMEKTIGESGPVPGRGKSSRQDMEETLKNNRSSKKTQETKETNKNRKEEHQEKDEGRTH